MTNHSNISPAARLRVAIDIGGTFTDLQILDESSGASFAHKTPTTPHDPAIGLATGLKEAMARFGFSSGQITMLIHGTTIATNAVLERKLPVGALITTAGFEDVLEIGRHLRHDVYAGLAEPRTLLIPRDRRYGVAGRIRADGTVETPLSEDHIARLVGQLQEQKVEAVAVIGLHAYANPVHEQCIAEILRAALPPLMISISSEISPEFREYERSSTTVLNALLMPVVGRYIARLEACLNQIGLNAPIFLVQSNGGVATPAMAARQPARLLLSGPSGGARAAEVIAQRIGMPNLVAVDMGGTSYDVSLVREGHVQRVNQGEIDNCPVRLPMVEMRTIGAGGGSLAAVDGVGALRVGPQSAGAEPGPACYGRGGTRPTVTDANLLLGRIDPDHFLGGAMQLHTGAAEVAITRAVAAPLQLTPEIAAEGVVQIAVAHMANAIRLSLFEKGLDPADFALASFGGAGGLHACATAAELGITRVIFPQNPGTLSAWGMLYTDLAHDLSRALLLPATAESTPRLNEHVETLRRMGKQRLAADGIACADQKIIFTLDLRYRGQAYEINVDFDPADDLGLCVAAFHAKHQAQYSHADPNAVVDIVNVRMTAVGKLPKPLAQTLPPATGSSDGRRRSFIDGQWRQVAVRQRTALLRDQTLAGPMLIEDPHATLFIPAGWSAGSLASGEIIAVIDTGDRHE